MTKSDFFKKLDEVAKDVDKNHIPYKNKGVGTWSAVLKQKGINCCTYVCIAMQRAGMGKSSLKFYIKNGVIKDTDAKWIRQRFTCKEHIQTKLSTAVKKGIVKEGDIVGAGKGAHTMVYQGVKNGKYTFYSLGKSSITYKKIISKTFKGEWLVGVVIRPKYGKAEKKVEKKVVKTTATPKKRVAIFVGHGIQTNGKGDCGCAWKGKTEVGLCKPIVGYAVKYLKASGVEVITDYPDNKINMVKQVALANAKKAHVEVAVHCDYSKAPKGTIPLYVSGAGKNLATAMNKHVVREAKCKTRGVCHRKDLYELNCTNMAAVIFEVGAITEYAAISKKAEQYGKGIAKGICEYLGVTFKEK